MKMLELAGHEVRIALDGPGAIKEIATFRPEIVVLDIGLPGMSGYEVASQIRQNASSQQLMLIAISGYGQREDQVRRARPDSITT